MRYIVVIWEIINKKGTTNKSISNILRAYQIWRRLYRICVRMGKYQVEGMIVRRKCFWDGKLIKREHSPMCILMSLTNYRNLRRKSINYDFISWNDWKYIRFSIKYNNIITFYERNL